MQSTSSDVITTYRTPQAFFKKCSKMIDQVRNNGLPHSFISQYPKKITHQVFFTKIAEYFITKDSSRAGAWHAIPGDLYALRGASSAFRHCVHLTAIMDQSEHRVTFDEFENDGLSNDDDPIEILYVLNDKKIGEFYPYKNKELPQDFRKFISNFSFEDALLDQSLFAQLNDIIKNLNHGKLKQWVAESENPPPSYISARESSSVMDLWEVYAAATNHFKRIYLAATVNGKNYVVDINNNGNHADDGTPIKVIFTCNLQSSSASSATLLTSQDKKEDSNCCGNEQPFLPLVPALVGQKVEEKASENSIEHIALNGCRVFVFGDKEGMIRDKLLESSPQRENETILNIHRIQYPAQHRYIDIKPIQSTDTSAIEGHEYKYEPMTMNLWHFSGKPKKYRDSHTLFLSHNCLYIIAIDGDKIDQQKELIKAKQWVDSIKDRAGKSPIIIVDNNADNLKQDDLARFRDSINEYVANDTNDANISVIDNNEKMNKVLCEEAWKIIKKLPDNFFKMHKKSLECFKSQSDIDQNAGICNKDKLFAAIKENDQEISDLQIEAFLKSMHDLGHLLYHADLNYIFYRPEILINFIDKILNSNIDRLSQPAFDFVNDGNLSDEMLTSLLKNSFPNEVKDDVKFLLSHAYIGIPGQFNSSNNNNTISLFIPSRVRPACHTDNSNVNEKSLNLNMTIGLVPDRKFFSKIITNLLNSKFICKFYPTECKIKKNNDVKWSVIKVAQKIVRINTDYFSDKDTIKNMEEKFENLLEVVKIVEDAFKEFKLKDPFILTTCFLCPNERVFSKKFPSNFCEMCIEKVKTNDDLSYEEIANTEAVVFVDGDQASHTVPRLARFIQEYISVLGIIPVRLIMGVSDNSSSIHTKPYQNEKWFTKMHPTSGGKDAVDIALVVKCVKLNEVFKKTANFFIVTDDHFGTALFQEIEKLKRSCFVIHRDEELDTAVHLLTDALYHNAKLANMTNALEKRKAELNEGSFSDPTKTMLITTLGNHHYLPSSLQTRYISMLAKSLLGMTADFMEKLKTDIEKNVEVPVSWIGNQFSAKNAKWVEFLSRHTIQEFLNIRLGRSKTGTIVLRSRSAIKNEKNAIIEIPKLIGSPIDWLHVTIEELRGLYDKYHMIAYNSHREFCKTYSLDYSNFNKWRQGKRESNKIKDAVIAFCTKLELNTGHLEDIQKSLLVNNNNINTNNNNLNAISANNNAHSQNNNDVNQVNYNASNKRKYEDVSEPLKKQKTLNDKYIELLHINYNALKTTLIQNKLMYHGFIDAMPSLWYFKNYKTWQPTQWGKALELILVYIIQNGLWEEFFNALNRLGLSELRQWVFGRVAV